MLNTETLFLMRRDHHFNNIRDNLKFKVLYYLTYKILEVLSILLLLIELYFLYH